MKLLAHGSGFKRPYRNDVEELRCGKDPRVGGDPQCVWFPHERDLEALGASSGGSTGVKDIEELIRLIEKQPTGSIGELRIIGHSNEHFFALSGDITRNNITFKEPAMVGYSATFLAAEDRLRNLRTRFADRAAIVLMGCGSGGTGGPLLNLLSRTFLLCVKGFRKPIQYAIDGTTRTGRPVPAMNNARFIANDAQITQRGKVMYSYATLAIEAVLGADMVDRSVMGTNAWQLTPDAESCIGQQMMNARTRLLSGTSKVPMIAASEVGYRLISQFHPERAGLVAGIGYSENLDGLQVAGDGTIKVGLGFVRKTTAATLSKRAAEMGQALDLLATKQTGTIPAR